MVYGWNLFLTNSEVNAYVPVYTENTCELKLQA